MAVATRMSHEEIIALYKQQDAGTLAQKCKDDIPTRLTQQDRAGRIAEYMRGSIASLDAKPTPPSRIEQHYDRIITPFKDNDSELGRKYRYDASAREERMERASKGAAYMRGSVSTLDAPARTQREHQMITITASAHRCVTPCSRCGGTNTHSTNGKLYCFDCRSIDGVKVSVPSLVCPKCKSNNFYIAPKSGDMHCYGCGKDSRGIGPKGVSRYTHFCTCGSGQVDVTKTHIICRTCGKRASKGLH